MKTTNKYTKPGMAYVYVIMAFAIIMTLLTCIITMFYGNLAQAKFEEKQTEAYYVAMSGIEMARAALLQKSDPTNDNSTLLYESYSIDKVSDINATPILGQKIKMDEGKGSADVIVFAYIKEGGDSRRRVKIYSVASFEDSNVTKTLSLSFPVENYKEEEWGKN